MGEDQHTETNLLRQARDQKNLTQRQLADILNVSTDAVRSWENNRRTPSHELMRKLCNFYQMSPTELGFESETVVEETILPKKDINRSRMIKRMRATWIDGVLKNSLYATVIALGLQKRPDALENPWKLAVQETTTNTPPRPLPPGTSIAEVFEDAEGELLILGEPGSGKTTLLLELARTLLQQANRDETNLIPVVFNLSSWATKQLPLDEWLVDELCIKYYVPRKVAHQWVQDDQLVILLDGLDEVAQGARVACVKAINSYKKQHSIVQIVICCRTTEYFAIETRVGLQQAVMIQPLTSEQIAAYLSRAGKRLDAVHVLLQNDPELQELASVPLMLNILSLTYADKSIDNFVDAPMTQQRIFSDYVERMLARRSTSRYTPEQTTSWLSWLAMRLKQFDQTVFYIERMQPEWLSDNRQLHQYRLTVMCLIYSLQSFVIAGLVACLRGDSYPREPGLFYWIGGGLGNSILGWMHNGIGGGLRGATSLEIPFSLVTILTILTTQRKTISSFNVRIVAESLRDGLIFGGIIGMLFSLILANITQGLSFGLLSGLIVTFLSASSLIVTKDMHKSMVLLLRDRLSLFPTVFVSGWISFFSVYSLESGRVNSVAIVFGALVSFFCGVTFGLWKKGTDWIVDLGIEIQPAEIVSWVAPSSKELIGSIRTGLTGGIIIMVTTTLVVGFASNLFYGTPYGIQYGLIFGLIVGLIAGTSQVLSEILAKMWSSSTLSNENIMNPNEGIHRSTKNAIMAGCITAPISGVASWLICGFAFGVIGHLASWPILAGGFALIFGMFFGQAFFLFNGGIATLEHYLLRWYLWRNSSLPWKYIHFLDYAVERIFLCKVGGGYIFYHRLLLDYFASLPIWDKKSNSLK